MNNSNELNILIRAKDEFSDVFKSFGDLCQSMQTQAKATAETLSSVTTAIGENLSGLRQSYTEFAKLSAMFGGGGLSVGLPEIQTEGGQNNTGVSSDMAGDTKSGGIYPFDGLNTALTLQNIESIKTAMLEFQEFKLADQEYITEMADTEMQRSAETTQQLMKDMQSLATYQTQNQNTRYQMLTGFLGNMSQATKLFGKETFGVTKALGIAEATVGAYLSFNRTMGAYPYPINAALAAVSLATSLAQVSRIASTSAGIAHGGLDYVPKEQTYLLDRGERVLSPRQNRDLTAFLDGGNANGVTIENIYIEILPNVTDAGALNDLDERALRDFVEDRLLNALRELKLAGYDY